MRALARAKLTLSLRVLGRREDGYHDLEALVVSLERPHDALTLSRRRGGGVEVSVTGPAAAGIPLDGTNLVTRAARLLAPAGGDAGLTVALHKEIPAGAGLGGGSADAAATLVAGARMLGAGLGPGELAALAAELGSDVPFCVTGGAAWMRGRGEVVEVLPTIAGLDLVVAAPPFALSTPAVYRAWDDLGGPAGERRGPVPAGLAGLVQEGLVNDLEPAAETVEGRLRGFRQALEDLAGAPAFLAGSGSAYAVIVAGGDEAAALAGEVEARLRARAWATRPAGEGVTLA